MVVMLYSHGQEENIRISLYPFYCFVFRVNSLSKAKQTDAVYLLTVDSELLKGVSGLWQYLSHDHCTA